MPCSNCRRSKNEECVYDNNNYPSIPLRSHLLQSRSTDSGSVPKPQEAVTNDKLSNTSESTLPSHPSTLPATGSTDTSMSIGLPSAQDTEESDLKLRVKQLEEQLADLTSKHKQPSAPSRNYNIETTFSRLGGTFHIHYEGDASGQPRNISRSVSHKKRLFGQSHLANVAPLVSG